MAIVEISIVPVGTGSTGVSEFVAQAVSLLKTSGLNFQITPMGTIIEGELSAVMEVARRMHETPFTKGAQRVYTVMKIDDRRDKMTAMNYKVASVESKL